ncbi:MAG: TauD/TfdA family dioxygenase [Gammaproteobacteria bacterium]|nr:TauD/TfdA family dioxygenase [Gammaproteobacteria bacterium]
MAVTDPTSSARSQQSPFSLKNEDGYKRWRDGKLQNYPSRLEELLVELDNPYALSRNEHGAMLSRVRKCNFVIYECMSAREDKDAARAVGQAFGLQRLDPNLLADDDGITSLTVVPGKSLRGYIPYTDKRILWHTDGYYNPPERQIRAMLLHCATPAATGGENGLMDHEIAYLLIREHNPDFIRALMAQDIMTIPENTETGPEQLRPAQTGPVFSIDPQSGALHMRYTARTRSIEWKQDELTQEAVRFLETVLAGTFGYIFRHRLSSGQGLLCNNVLHSRTAFTDDPDTGSQRLLFRARYYDRIQGTEPVY